LEEREAICTMENPPSMKYSFQKLTQFSKGNNGLDGAAPNKDVFLRRGILS
jgi:hypothetical protein